MRKIIVAFACIIFCELVGILATPFTITAIPTWYAHLHKPSFSPPNWIFGPVWTLLYLLMGLSLYIVFQKGWKNNRVQSVNYIFFLQLFLNFLWSFLFFGLHSPLLGLFDIIVLLIFIALTMMKFYAISKIAVYLLIPYFLWVSFATILNIGIVILNR